MTSFDVNRRKFLQATAAIAASSAAVSFGAEVPAIQGFEREAADPNRSKEWKPVSNRKIRVGLIGHGVCQFASQFGFEKHPNVEVVAVSDLIPARCAEMAQRLKCKRTYPSLEELVKDDQIEAVFIATDAPSHAKHVIDALKHGKHVGCAVPACFGSLEEADQVFEAVQQAQGLKYMMFETSCFHQDLYDMRQLFQAGALGDVVYAEGEYFHYMAEPIDSFNGWRIGLPPQWYPTHSNAYYIGVTGGSFTEVSCQAMPSKLAHLQPENNRYKNPFGTEVALFQTNNGGTARMAVSWDTPGDSGERGRIRGNKGSYYGKYEGLAQVPNQKIERPPLPPTVEPGGHGGAHGYLTNEFVTAILEDRKPLIDIATALNLTVSGIVAHQSALKDGQLMKIPQYKTS